MQTPELERRGHNQTAARLSSFPLCR
jgi:hypothetical protein